MLVPLLGKGCAEEKGNFPHDGFAARASPPESSEAPNTLAVQCFLNCHCHKDSFRFTSRQGPHPPHCLAREK